MSEGKIRNEVRETLRRDRFDERSTDGGPSGSLEKYDTVAFKIFGKFFESRRDSFYGLQQWLVQNQNSMKVERYLSRLSLTAVLVTVILLGLSAVSIGGLRFAGVSLPFSPLVMGSAGLGLSLLGGAFTGLLMYIWPKITAAGRKREINYTLPYSVTFIYALSRGGMNMIEIMKILSKSEDTYGEMSREIKPIVRDIEYFSRDLPHALRRAARRSPSYKFADFADDFVGVLTSGADISRYLEQQSDDMLEEAERQQRNFIQTLELLGEVYVTVFVAGPLFLIIITVVMSMLGGSSSAQLDGIVYGLIPILNIGFFFLVDTISSDEADVKAYLEKDETTVTSEELEEEHEELVEIDEDLQSIKEQRKKRERTAIIRKPLETLRNEPKWTLLFTVPAALLWIAVIFGGGFVELSYEALVQNPVKNTGSIVVAPLFLLCVPYSFFYEWNGWRQRRMVKRFPDSLKRLASSNAIGMSLTESLDSVADNTSGNLGDEFRKVRNDIEWNNDINGALVSFANRVRVPVISRTIKLITEANRATGDIEDVLEVAARNVVSRERLRKERQQQLLMYTVVIIISFLVYLFVIGMLDTTFLTQIEKVGNETQDANESTTQPSQGSQQSSGQFDLGAIPTQKFRMVFYHSALIQGMGSGLLAGYLKNNDVRSGLKYFILLSVVATVAFAII